MNVLVIAPHPDDEAIGCGGALRLHATSGDPPDRVVCVYLTSGELGLKHLPIAQAHAIREAEATAAAAILGIAQTHFLRQPDWFLADFIPQTAELLADLLHQENPELIYLPHAQDNHPDHRATTDILRATGFAPPATRTCEIWSPLTSFDHVQDITPVMHAKLRAIRAYKSQLTEFDYAQAIRGLNRYRGILAGKCRYAEVFSTPQD